MKFRFKIPVLFLLLLLTNRNAEAGVCIASWETITLTRQSEVDSFPINYPGCDSVFGVLIVEGSGITNINALIHIKYAEVIAIGSVNAITSVTNLHGLDSLKFAKKLEIKNNPLLISMEGLDSFEEADYLTVIENPSLINLSGLNNLKKVNNLFDISYNSRLVNLDGLNKLSSVFEFNILHNQALTSIQGMTTIDSINLVLYIYANLILENLSGLDSIAFINTLTIEGNAAFNSFAGLNPAIEFISSVAIVYNPSLINMNGMNHIKQINFLTISGNQNLINMTGFDVLNTIDYALIIYNNYSLINLAGFGMLATVKSMEIDGNYSLQNLSGFNPGLNTMSSALIRDNNSLTSLSGLNNLKSITYLYILMNPVLVNLNALSLLDTIYKSLTIQENNSLVNLNGLGALRLINALWIGNNSNLTTLSGINPSLQTIKFIWIDGNQSLTNMTGLESLRSVDTIIIYNNTSLINLEGLNSLNTIESLIEILFNSNLYNLEGLNAVNTVPVIMIGYNDNLYTLDGLNPALLNVYAMRIYNNPVLKCCYTAQLIMDNNPVTLNDIIIHSNDLGCSSVDEIYAMSSPDCCFTVSRQTPEICQGQTYIVGNNTYSVAGVYFDTLVNSVACDSFIITMLTVSSSLSSQTDVSICSGQQYTLTDGRKLTTSGVYYDTLQSSILCDSIVTVNLNVNLPLSSSVQTFICQGQQYVLPDGQTVSSTGIYKDTVQNSTGCDSIITTNLTVYQITNSSKSISICNGQNYTLQNGRVVNTSGIYTDTLLNSNSCDSLVTITLNVVNALQLTVDVSMCKGKTHTLPKGNTISVSGIYKDTLRSSFGCDSIITTNLTFTNPIPFTNTVSICDGQAYILPDGNSVTTAGTYTDTIRQTNTCDSIVITNLTVLSNNFTVSLNATDTIESGNTITLVPVYTGGTAANWNWTPASALSCTTCELPSAAPLQTTLYQVKARTADGCEDTAQTHIIVRQASVYVPQAFTPNNDGVNDVAEVFAANPAAFSMKIYNRWGELVFESRDVNTKWNGTYKGENCPQESYSFILDVTLQNQKQYHKQGSILLLR